VNCVCMSNLKAEECVIELPRHKYPMLCRLCLSVVQMIGCAVQCERGHPWKGSGSSRCNRKTCGDRHVLWSIEQKCEWKSLKQLTKVEVLDHINIKCSGG
jgi:hypothetical protein